MGTGVWTPVLILVDHWAIISPARPPLGDFTTFYVPLASELKKSQCPHSCLVIPLSSIWHQNKIFIWKDSCFCTNRNVQGTHTAMCFLTGRERGKEVGRQAGHWRGEAHICRSLVLVSVVPSAGLTDSGVVGARLRKLSYDLKKYCNFPFGVALRVYA